MKCFYSFLGVFVCLLHLDGGDLLDGWYEWDEVVSVAGGVGGQYYVLDYDTANKALGDFSIRYQHRSAANAGRLAFSPFPHSAWAISQDDYIRFWISVEQDSSASGPSLALELRDVEGNVARTPIQLPEGYQGEWVFVETPVTELDGSAGLELESVAEIALAEGFSEGMVLRVDGLHLRTEEGIIGITSKGVTQRVNDAKISRIHRAENIYERMINDSDGHRLSRLYAHFWLAEDLEWANSEIERLFVEKRDWMNENYGFADTWNLFATPWILRMYFTFGPGENATNNRLTSASEEILLELLWERTKGKNDIHWARNRNPWIMDGSENHDINGIVSSYLSSLVFKNHPDFAERIYPNVGKGGGAGYWFHRDRGLIRFYGPYGRADFSDGGSYVAADHYEAWGEVIKEVITARAKKGFFLEQASPTYMKYTLGFLQDVYEFDASSAMREHVGNFLDLVWTKWALESLHGQRGGAKTRDHTILNVQGDSMYQMARFLMGSYVTQTDHYYSLPASNYELPEMVWRVALDRQGLGEFSLLSRTIGEEPGELPREPGLERSLNLDAEHRMYRYSWITPHSILGAQMDHPLAVHSHLSPTSRLYGINFSSHPDARIFPIGVRQIAEDDWQLVRRGGPMYRAVQHEHVLVSQQSRGYIQVNPDWFPQRSLAPVPFGVYFSPKIETIVEKEGWIFAQSGAAYAAVRIVEGEFMAGDGIDDVTSFTEYYASDSLVEPLRKDSYQWSRDQTLAVARNAFSGLIMETSSLDRHENLEAFIKDVLEARLELQKTVVPGWYTLVYQGTGDSPLIELNMSNNEVPRVDGQALNYEPEFLFESPYLQSTYKSGRIQVEFGGSKHPFEFE